ncbi:hypothetical protein [Azospirillum argentinense]
MEAPPRRIVGHTRALTLAIKLYQRGCEKEIQNVSPKRF